MTEETLCNQKQQDYLTEIKDRNYIALHTLAELKEEETSQLSNECEIMDYALRKVIRDGSCADFMEAIKEYVLFNFAKQMISMPK